MGFIGKIIVLAGVIAAVWFGWRWWQRVQSGQLERPRSPTPRDDPRPRDDSKPPRAASDMLRCPVCDDYVSVNARRCERPTCPRG